MARDVHHIDKQLARMVNRRHQLETAADQIVDELVATIRLHDSIVGSIQTLLDERAQLEPSTT